MFSLLAFSLIQPASAQFFYEETFRFDQAPGWDTYQGSSSPGPRLTAGTNALGVDPEPTGLPLDSAGQGWLRLATLTNNQSNGVVLDTKIPSASNTILVEFDIAFWNRSSGTGADGVTFFMYDASVPTFAPGGFGGSLGYAQRDTSTPGLAGGYVGVGLDVFGNFSNPTESRVGGPGSRPGEVVLRGPGSGMTGYEYLAGTDGSNTTVSGNPAIPSIPTTFGGQEFSFPLYDQRPDQDAADFRSVQIELSDTNQLTVRMKMGFTGSYVDLFTADLSSYTRPDQLRIGFTGGTGGVNMVYEVRNLTVQTSGSTNTWYWANALGGTWGVGGNWSPATVPTPQAIVVFNDQVASLTGPVTVTMDGPDRTVDSIFFGGNQSYTLTPSASQKLIFDASSGDSYISLLNSPTGNASHTINADIQLNDTLRIHNFVADQTLTLNGDLALGSNNLFLKSFGTTEINGDISGSGNLTKQGTGTAVLAGNNTYTGTTTVSDGILEARSNTALGATSSGTTVQSGATLGLSGGISIGAEPLTLSGSGFDGLGALRNLDGANSFAGNITLAASSVIGTDASSSLTTSGTIALGPAGRTITFLTGAGATHTHTGDITSGTFGGDRVIKTGEGTLIIQNAVSHQGANIIQAGTLEIRNAGALGSAGSVGTTVQSGGTLALANNITLGFHELRLNGPGADGKAALWNESGNNSVANNITLQSDTAIGAASGTTLTLTQGINAGGGYTLTITGPGTVQTNNNLVNVGAIEIEQGVLNLNGSVTPSAPTTTIAAGATLRSQTNSNTLGSIAGAGNIELSPSLTWQVLTFGGNNTNTTFSGVVSGVAQMTKVGTGTTTFSGANTFTGTLNLNAGTIRLGADNVFANSMTLNLNGGTFAANGFSDVMGTLNRSAASTMDFLGSSSVLTFSSTTGGSAITINNWAGNIAGGGPDQFRVTSAAAPGSLTNINFTGWGDGAAVVGSAGSWEIVPTLTGFQRWNNASALNTQWGNNGNWVGSGPQPNAVGARGYFGDDAPNATQPVILEGNKTIGNMILAGTGNRNYNFNATGGNRTLTFDQTGSASAHLVVTGTQSHIIGQTNTNNQRVNVALNDALLIQNNSSADTGLTFGTSGGAHTFALGGNTLTVTGTSRTIIHSQVTGTGSIVKNGTGILRLTDNNNTFSGGVTLNEGTIEIAPTGTSTTVLGTGTLTINGGTLEAFGAARTISNAFTINNSFSVLGSNNLTMSGAGTVSTGTHTVTIGSGITTTMSGNLTGSGGLIKDGSGTLTLSGGTKTFSGGLTVNGGTVEATRGGDITLGTADGANNIAGAGAITVNSGGTFNLTQTGNNPITLRGSPLTNDGGTITITSTGNNEARDFFIGTNATNTGHLISNDGTTTVTVGDDIRLRPNSTITVSGGTVNLNPADAFITEGTAGNSALISVTETGSLNIDITGARSDNNQITIGQHDRLTISGPAANATFTGQTDSNINLTGTINLFDGGTLTVTQGTTNLQSTTVLDGGTDPTKGTLSVNGNLTLHPTATVTNAPNLNLTTSTTATISGTAADTSSKGWGTITHSGSGTTTIASSINNLDANRITITSGTLLLGASNQIANTTDITMAGGTFHTGGNSEIVDTLTLTADSTINMGAGNSILRFSDSSAIAWVAGTTLFITNWSGDVNGGGTDQLYIGTTNLGVTASQLSQIKFIDPIGFAPGTYAAQILATGEIVPIPEPTTILVGLALLLLAAWRERRRWWPALASCLASRPRST
ncbi:MAG: autotransporter-associated beta strand repeat-containing protein [Verrucomicrobiia bacterium]